MTARGYYGTSAAYVGQVPTRQSTVYVERDRSNVPWILGALSLGASLLWARHQSRQIEQLYKASGMPYKSFASDLRDSARSVTSRLTSRSARGDGPTRKSED